MTTIAGTSFRRGTVEAPKRIIVALSALDKCGKTHFSLTAPDPIAHLNFDIGTEGVVDKFEGKEILIADYRIEAGRTLPETAAKADAMWTRFLADYRYALAHCRTVVLDTATEVWELLRLARFGKLTQIKPHHYGPVNAEYAEVIKLAYGSPCNLILLHKLTEEYEDGKDAKGQLTSAKTGRLVRKGQKDTGFLVQVNARITKDPDTKRLAMLVENCRQQRSLDGLELPEEMIDFPTLAQLVIPTSAPSDWE